MSKAVLVKDLDDKGMQSFPLSPKESRVGRASDSHIAIQDKSISRHHATIELRNDGCLRPFQHAFESIGPIAAPRPPLIDL